MQVTINRLKYYAELYAKIVVCEFLPCIVPSSVLKKGQDILGPIEYPQAKDTVCHGAKLVKTGPVILEEKSM